MLLNEILNVALLTTKPKNANDFNFFILPDIKIDVLRNPHAKYVKFTLKEEIAVIYK